MSYRVLVSAYACEPGRGSEPGVGWNWARAIAQHNEAWILTRWNNRAPIERELAKNPLPNAHFVYFDLPKWARFWKRGARGLRLYYFLWQIAAYFKAAQLHREIGFQVTHHVSLVTYWMPSFLALLRVPFVWGPVGGGECAPAAFRSAFTWRGRIHEVLRDLGQRVARLNPYLRFTAHRSAVALAATGETAVCLRRIGCKQVEVYTSMGLPAEEIRRLEALPAASGRDQIVFAQVGDLVHLKGCTISLRAFAKVSADFPNAQLWFIGSGPEREMLERLAAELRIHDRVTFWGQLPRPATLEKLGACDIVVSPSLHDSGGCAITEALASGRPVICFELGGPALQVTPECGIKIPAIQPRQATDDLAAAMRTLAADPALRIEMGARARQRVREQLAWSLKGEQMTSMYRRVIDDARLARSGEAAHRAAECTE